MRLLPAIAPDLAPPQALRSSGHEVAVAAAGERDLPARTVDAVRAAAEAGLVGVVVARSVRQAVTEALDAAGVAWAAELRPNGEPVVVLAPDEAKGLEFDAVVVVEPAALVEESDHGLRALFVALTRCTDRLALVHARPLPPELGLDGSAPGEDGDAGEEEVAEAAGEAAPDEGERAGDAAPAPAPDEAAGGAVGPEAPAAGPAEEEAAGRRPLELAALDGLDDDVVRAIATAVADQLGRIVRPEVLPAIAAELARIAEERRRAGAAPVANGGTTPERPGVPLRHR